MINRSHPFILFITGVSGSGKTTLVEYLCDQIEDTSTICLHFDSIGVPSTEEMIRLYGSPSEWQRIMTEQWIEKILTEYSNKNTIYFEGQINLKFIVDSCKKHNFDNYQIVLVHCENAIRHKRLIKRQQPELINPEMDNWAQFLKKQAAEFNVPILDSDQMTVAQTASSIRNISHDKNRSG